MGKFGIGQVMLIHFLVSRFTELVLVSFDNVQVNKIRHCVLAVLLGSL